METTRTATKMSYQDYISQLMRGGMSREDAETLEAFELEWKADGEDSYKPAGR